MPFDPDQYLKEDNVSKDFNPDTYLKKKVETISEDSEILSEPSIESGKDVSEISPTEKKIDLPSLSGINKEIEDRKHETQSEFKARTGKTESSKAQLDAIQKEIKNNSEKLLLNDASLSENNTETSIREIIKKNALEKTGNDWVAEQSALYFDKIKQDRDIINSEVKEEPIPEQAARVLNNINEQQNKELGINQEIIPDAVPLEKIERDYVNYLRGKNDDRVANYDNGMYSKGDNKSYSFRLDALSHQTRLLDAKAENSIIDDEDYIISKNEINKKFTDLTKIDDRLDSWANSRDAITFADYVGDSKFLKEKQRKIDEDYNQALIDVKDWKDPVKHNLAAITIFNQNVTKPFLAGAGKFGVGVVSSAARLSSLGKPADVSREINNAVDNFMDYASTERSMVLTPTKIQGELREDGEIQGRKILPQAMEMIGGLIPLLTGAGEVEIGLKGLGIGEQVAHKGGLFVSSAISAYNNHYQAFQQTQKESDNNTASAYALASSFGDGLVMTINPLEALRVKPTLNISPLMGKLSKTKVTQENLKTLVKSQFENARFIATGEAVSNITNATTNMLAGTNLKTSTTAEQFWDELIVSGIVFGSLSAQGFKSGNRLTEESLHAAISDMPKFEKALESDKIKNQYTPEQIAQVKKDVATYASILSSINPDVSASEKSLASIALTQKKQLKEALRNEESKDELLQEPEVIENIKEEIEITNITAAKALGKPVQTLKEFQEEYIKDASKDLLPGEELENKDLHLKMAEAKYDSRHKEADKNKETPIESPTQKTSEVEAETKEEKKSRLETKRGKSTTGNKLFNDPNPETKEISNTYKKEKGIEVSEAENITEINIEEAKKRADDYEEMKHDPNNPEVMEAYENMASQTLDQHNKIAEKGYTFEVYEGEGEPYKSSDEMISDVRDNKHIYILATDKEFGGKEITDKQRKENPLLRDSGIKDVNGKTMLVNDIFRGVHDFFGHTERGNSFGAIGEENAWDSHSRMYTGSALRAMTTETRGQNSWVNFGKQMRNKDGSIKKKGDEGYMSPTERPFAEQKIGLLPEGIKKGESEADEFTEEEISEAYAEREKSLENQPKLSHKQQIIHENLGRVKSSDYDHYGDAGWRKGDAAVRSRMNLLFFGKDAMAIDKQAEMMSEDFGVEITEQDIIEYINDRTFDGDKFKAPKVEDKKSETKVENDYIPPEAEDWLGDSGIKPQFHANIAESITPYFGDKLPLNDIKGALKEFAKTKSIDTALDKMKSTDWYKNQSDSKQKAFDSDFRKSLGEEGVETVKSTKENDRIIKTKERTIFKNQVKDIVRGVNLGKSIQKQLTLEDIERVNKYIDENLSDFSLSPLDQKQTRNILKRLNGKNVEKQLETVDKLIKKYEEKDRVKTINEIYELINKKKNFETKSGTKSVLKVDAEVYEYIKTFDTSNLDLITRKEAKETLNLLKDALSKGVLDKKKIERQRKAKIRIAEGRAVVNFFHGKPTKVSGKKEILEALEDRNNVAIINGQLIGSKGKYIESETEQGERSDEISSVEDFQKFNKENPDIDLHNVSIYRVKNKQEVLKNINYTGVGIKGVTKKAGKIISYVTMPHRAKANLDSMLVGLMRRTTSLKTILKGDERTLEQAKGGREQIEEFQEAINFAEHSQENNTLVSHKKVMDGILNVFSRGVSKTGKIIEKIGFNNYVSKVLSKEAPLDIKKDAETPYVVDEVVDWYNSQFTGEGKKYLENSGIDIDKLNKFMEKPENSHIKDYAKETLDFYNEPGELRDRVASEYKRRTGKNLPEGIYYPLSAQSAKDINKEFDAIDESGNVDFNKFNVGAGSLKERVVHNGRLNLSGGALKKRLNYIKEMERAINFSPVADMANQIFNKHTIPEMIKLTSPEQFRDLKDQLSLVITGRDVRASGSPKNGAEILISVATHLATINALTFKVASIPLQATSALHWSAASGLSKMEWLAGFAPKQSEIDFLWKISTSPYSRNRVKGRSIDLIINNIKDKVSSSKIGNEGKGVTDKSIGMAMSAITVGDMSGVLLGGLPFALGIYRKNLAKGMSEDAAYDNAYRQFTKQSELVQQSTRDSQTSHFKRTAEGAFFSIYRTSQTAAMNQAMSSTRLLMSRSGLTKAEIAEHSYKAFYFYGSSSVFSAIKIGILGSSSTAVAALVSGYGDDEKKAKGKKALYDQSLSVAQAKFDGIGINGVLLNIAINSITGNDWKNHIPAFEGVEELFKTVGGLGVWAAKAKPWSELTKKERDDAAAAIPDNALKKQVKSLKALGEDKKTLWQFILNQKSEIEEMEYQGRKSEDLLWKQLNNIPFDVPESERSGSRGSRKTTR